MADRLDRFTKRARRTLTLAQEEATRLQHNYLGTEHLLLALTREDQGIACRVLLDLDVDFDRLRRDIETGVGRGQRLHFGKTPLTPRVKRLIELAVDEARIRQHQYIGTEHLLLGMLREGGGVAYEILLTFVQADAIRDRIDTVMAQSIEYAWRAIEETVSKEIGQLLTQNSVFTRLQHLFGLHKLQQADASVQMDLEIARLQEAYLKQRVSELSAREQKVLQMRFGLDGGKSHSVMAVANQLGVAREQIQQTESKALRQIRDSDRLVQFMRTSDAWQTEVIETATASQVLTDEVDPETRERLMSEIYEVVAREERNRLARDLHDSIKQQIFSISVSAAAIEARWEKDPQGARAALADVQHSAQAAMVEMNALLQQLRPDPLENMGLLEALREQCEALDFRTGATVTTVFGELPPKVRLPITAQETIFRLVQEGLSNIARHARATQVQLRLEPDTAAETLYLTIIDNGQGFNVAEATTGMGLANMRDRVGLLNGQFELKSHPDTGTSIKIIMPLLETPHA